VTCIDTGFGIFYDNLRNAVLAEDSFFHTRFQALDIVEKVC